MKTTIFLLLAFLFLGGCTSSSPKTVPDNDLEVILIDPDKYETYLDLSEILSDSIEIVPLETTDESLISQINQVELYKDKIYISDEKSAKILVFTTSGQYLYSIGKQGMGPGEYSNMWDFTFIGDSVIVKDRYRNKYIVYDLYGNYHREIFCDVPHFEIVSFGNNAYLVSNYMQSDYGNYNLFKFDLRTSNIISPEIPFNEKIDKSGYGLRRYSSKYGDAATLIYPLNDTIYTLKEDIVYPSYIIHYTSRSLPEDLDVERDELFDFVRKNRYLKGFEYLQNSKDYLLGYYSDDSFKYFLFDKRNANIRVGKWLSMGLFGNMILHYFYTTASGELYILQDGASFSFNWKSMRGFCTNSYYREKIDSIAKKIGDDSNPILFKCKFKDVDN